MLQAYLAGAVRGTMGGWRDGISDIQGVCFVHPGARIPAEHEESHSEIYGPADRISVRKCDILLANCDRIEGDHGTAVEIGMALALGTEVMLVCPNEETKFVWRFAAGAVPHVFASLSEALHVIAYAAAQAGGTARCAGG